MPNLCETCPIQTKTEYCCGSSPQTGETGPVRFKKSGLIVDVCAQLENDGKCADYSQRPEPCKGYECEKLYSLGLGAQR